MAMVSMEWNLPKFLRKVKHDDRTMGHNNRGKLCSETRCCPAVSWNSFLAKRSKDTTNFAT